MRRMRTSASWLIVLVVGLAATSCTGDDDADDAAPAPPVTIDAAVETTGAATVSTSPAKATTTQAPTTTDVPATPTTLPPPPVVEAVPVDVPEDLTSAGAVALVPAQSGRGYLLVGFGREEGRPSTPHVWESFDGANWADTPPRSPPTGPRITVSSAAWMGPTLALGGSTTDDAGPARSRLVRRERHRLRCPRRSSPVGPAAAGASSSGVSALAMGDGGLVAAGWVESDVTTTFVTIRGADGAWHPATVPELPSFSVYGVAASGATIVITGSDNSVVPEQAQALVSTDAGASFQVADTASLGGGVASLLGGVAVVPGGFVASACAPTDTGDVTALARSADGVTWCSARTSGSSATRDLGDLDFQSAGCGDVAVLGDRVHLGLLDINGWDLAVAPDGTAVGREIHGGQARSTTPSRSSSPPTTARWWSA